MPVIVTVAVGVGRLTENKDPLEVRQLRQWQSPQNGGTEDLGMEIWMAPQLHAPRIESELAIGPGFWLNGSSLQIRVLGEADGKGRVRYFMPLDIDG